MQLNVSSMDLKDRLFAFLPPSERGDEGRDKDAAPKEQGGMTTQSRRAHARGTPDGDHGEENSERWLLTYADMITLLFVLFIVLFALSKVNEAKYRQFQESLRENKIVGVSMVKGTTIVARAGPSRSTPLPSSCTRSPRRSPRP